MRNSLVFGTLLAASLGLPALAQNAPPMPPASSSPMSNTVNASFDALKPHLTLGADIYDGNGKRIGTLATVGSNANDGFLIHESSDIPSGTPIMRRLPAGSVSWDGTHLVSSISGSALDKLPSE